jgi:hypothetical protein
MGTSSWLATWMDEQYLRGRGATIWPPMDVAGRPPTRTGAEVAAKLGPRKLLRYLLPNQVGRFRTGSDLETYATPTPYTPEETLSWLVLPGASSPRPYALILEPSLIPMIQGPMMVAGGQGIQYILPEGFPAGAVVVPGAPGMHWEIVVE